MHCCLNCQLAINEIIAIIVKICFKLLNDFNCFLLAVAKLMLWLYINDYPYSLPRRWKLTTIDLLCFFLIAMGDKIVFHPIPTVTTCSNQGAIVA